MDPILKIESAKPLAVIVLDGEEHQVMPITMGASAHCDRVRQALDSLNSKELEASSSEAYQACVDVIRTAIPSLTKDQVGGLEAPVFSQLLQTVNTLLKQRAEQVEAALNADPTPPSS